MKARILHVIQSLSRGGAARSLVGAASAARDAGAGEHRAVSLCRAAPSMVTRAAERGLAVVDAPGKDELRHELARADIVCVHFWNTPELYALLTGPLPPMRLVLWCHVAGDRPPQVLIGELVSLADLTLASSPHTAELPVLASAQSRVGMIPAAGGWDRLQRLPRRSRDTFNVGYIGTVDFAKLHPRFVRMSAEVDVPDARFVVCGGGNALPALRGEAQALGAAGRFQWRGYVEDVGAVLADLDVFGYPLCPANYGATELVLAEAMYCGVPPVVLPYGGAPRSVTHGHTGLIASDEADYPRAIEYLHAHPDERRRLGRNAREHARRTWSLAGLGPRWAAVFQEMMEQPKRARSWRAATIERSAPAHARAAARFAQTLGPPGSPFRVSVAGTEIDQLLCAEREIAESAPVLCSADAGGILHWRRAYPQDAHLRLWSALVLQHQGRSALAAGELSAAQRLGLRHWRVSWYLAQAARTLGHRALEEQAMRDVPAQQPALAERHPMRA